MNLPRLHKLAGLPSLEVKLVESEAHGAQIQCAASDWDALVVEGEQFLRAGGAISPEWWEAQSPLERAALAEAGDRVWLARAAAIGTASSGPRAAAEVLEPVDGGESRSVLQLVQAASRGARELQGRELPS